MVKASRRGIILIEPYKQLRFGMMFLVINLVFSSLIFAVFGYFIWDVYDALSNYFKLDDKQSVVTMAKLIQPAFLALGLIALFIVTTLIVSARYTHQIYGPMVSIRRFLDEMLSDRKPSPIKLRASDQLRDLAEKLNDIAKKYYSRHDLQSIEALKRFVDELHAQKQPEHLDISKDDPLHELAAKLNRLARQHDNA